MTEGLESVANLNENLDQTRIPEAFRAKVVETVRALAATRTFFTGIDYEVFAGIATAEGAWKGLRMVETLVDLEWGEGMPNRFTVRSFLDSENGDETVISGIIEAMKRVVDFCVGRAEEPHTDYMRRFLATMTEIKTILGNCHHGNHLELLFEPGDREAQVSVTMFLDGRSMDDLQTFNEDNMRVLRDDLVAFLKDAIEDNLESENALREPQEEPVRGEEAPVEEPVEVPA